MSSMEYIIKQILQSHLPDLNQSDIVIVDVGCGNGDEVYRLKNIGYSAYGCDLKFKKGDFVSVLEKNGNIKKIDKQYRLPFENEFADIVYTNQVVEHVRDIDVFFSEICRITKPGGISVHCYPNINKLVEPHIKVPLATRIQSHGWIQLWNRLGLFDMPTRHWKESGVQKMTTYLHNSTWYKTNKELKSIAQTYFDEVWFDGDLFLRSISEHKKSKVFRVIPGGGRLFNSVWTSLLLSRKKGYESSITENTALTIPEERLSGEESGIHP